MIYLPENFQVYHRWRCSGMLELGAINKNVGDGKDIESSIVWDAGAVGFNEYCNCH